MFLQIRGILFKADGFSTWKGIHQLLYLLVWMKDLFSESRSKQESYIECTSAEMWVYDGILYFKYKSGVIVDIKVAKEVFEARMAISNNVSYAVMCDVKGVKYWTTEAQTYQNKKENYQLFKACALIYPTHKVASVLINFYLRMTKPLIPAKFFVDQEEGYNWLLQYK